MGGVNTENINWLCVHITVATYFYFPFNILQKNDFSDKYICNILSKKCKNSLLSDTETISSHTERISTLDF